MVQAFKHWLLLVQVFQQLLQEHSEGENAEKDLTLAIIWRACAIVGGMYLFYVFEVLLRKLTDRAESQEVGSTIAIVLFISWTA